MNRHDILLRCILPLVPVLLASPALAAESAVLRELMGDSVYRQSGVRELSPEQMSVLEQWVTEHTTTGQRPEELENPSGAQEHGAPEIVDTDTAPAPSAPAATEIREPDVIRSRIDGHFDGWRDGDTRFPLENGQIWKQRQPATFITDLESPAVIIRKSRFGYTMEVPAIGRKVHVTRIR